MAGTGPAAEWAAQQPSGSNLRWRQLEEAAWSGNPAVTRAYDGKLSRGAGLAGGAALLVFVVLLLAPVLAIAFALDGNGVIIGRVFVEDNGLADDTRVHGSALFMAISVVPLLVGGVAWLRGQRSRRGTMARGYAIFTIVAGAITLLVMTRLHRHVPDWAAYAVAPVVAIVVGVVVSVMVGVLATTVDPVEQGPVYANRTAVVAAIAELSDAERVEVRRDLETALDDLLARDVITSKEREKVRGAPLGLLTRTLNEPRGGGTSVD